MTCLYEMQCCAPDMRQHEVVNASRVLLLHRRRVDQMTQVLIHQLRYEWREGSLRPRNTALVKEHSNESTTHHHDGHHTHNQDLKL